MPASWQFGEINMAELIDISNAVNEQVCKPIAEETLTEAKSLADEFAVSGQYRDTLRVEVEPRTSEKDWARCRVVSGVVYGMQVEAKHGTLARALGST